MNPLCPDERHLARTHADRRVAPIEIHPHRKSRGLSEIENPDIDEVRLPWDRIATWVARLHPNISRSITIRPGDGPLACVRLTVSNQQPGCPRPAQGQAIHGHAVVKLLVCGLPER